MFFTALSNAGEFSKEQEAELLAARQWKLDFNKKYPNSLVLNDTEYDNMFEIVCKGIEKLGYTDASYYVISEIRDERIIFYFFINLKNMAVQWVGEFIFQYQEGLNA